ncbi:hypothetical protein Ancab_028159, partial [Ancistrocladus abbreviatus]
TLIAPLLEVHIDIDDMAPSISSYATRRDYNAALVAANTNVVVYNDNIEGLLPLPNSQ